jgi:DNA mismatch repair ATPase MutL
MELFYEMFAFFKKRRNFLTKKMKNTRGILDVCERIHAAVCFSVPHNGKCLSSRLVYNGTATIQIEEARSS